eukprot:755866-Hanusia_phi.AAC.1
MDPASGVGGGKCMEERAGGLHPRGLHALLSLPAVRPQSRVCFFLPLSDCRSSCILRLASPTDAQAHTSPPPSFSLFHLCFPCSLPHHLSAPLPAHNHSNADATARRTRFISGDGMSDVSASHSCDADARKLRTRSEDPWGSRPTSRFSATSCRRGRLTRQ